MARAEEITPHNPELAQIEWKQPKRIVMGSVAIVLWIVLFGCGLLLNSMPYR